METSVKNIKIGRKTSIIEGNLAEMPLVKFGKDRVLENVITYPWVSQGKQCSIEIRGSAKYGLPKEYDFDVLLALLRLYAKQKTLAYNQLITSDKEINTEDATVHFTLNELAKELKKGTDGRSIKRLQEAIETLKDTSVHGQIYDTGNSKYITRKKKGISVIEEYQFYEVQEDEKYPGWREVKEQTYVIFNKFFVRSIHNSYFKYFNYEQYLSLGKSGIAKKLYLLIDKWRNNRPALTLHYSTLYMKIPLDLEKPEAYNKRILKTACNKLVDKGIVKKCTFGKNTVVFYFVSSQSESKRLQELKSKYLTFETINQWFIDNGFTLEEVSHFMNIFIYDIEYVKALIRYVEDNRPSVRDVKPYVMKGMTQICKYEIDHKYYNNPPKQDTKFSSKLG